MGELLDFRKNVPFLLGRGQYNLEASGYFETKPLMDRGLTVTNRTEIVDGFAVYASEFFALTIISAGRKTLRRIRCRFIILTGDGWEKQESNTDLRPEKNFMQS